MCVECGINNYCKGGGCGSFFFLELIWLIRNSNMFVVWCGVFCLFIFIFFRIRVCVIWLCFVLLIGWWLMVWGLMVCCCLMLWWLIVCNGWKGLGILRWIGWWMIIFGLSWWFWFRRVLICMRIKMLESVNLVFCFSFGDELMECEFRDVVSCFNGLCVIVECEFGEVKSELWYVEK